MMCPRCKTELRDNPILLRELNGQEHTPDRCADVLKGRLDEAERSRETAADAAEIYKARCKALEAERDELRSVMESHVVLRVDDYTILQTAKATADALTRRVAELEEAMREALKNLQMLSTSGDFPETCKASAVYLLEAALAASQAPRKEGEK